MQVTPSTANDPNVAIPDIHKLEPNVHAGNKYLRYLRNKYFDNPEINPLKHMILIYILAKNRLDDTIGIRYLNTDIKLSDKLVHWIDGTAGYG